jgi:hypothetical protein
MTIILVCVALLAIGLLIVNFGGYEWEAIGILLCLSGGLGLALCVLTIPLNRMAWQSSFVEVEAIRQSRETATEIEATAWRMKAAEVNAHLASGRYYNGTLFDLWIPDQINQVEPIQ